MDNVEPAIWRDESKTITYILPVVRIKVPLSDSSLIPFSQIHLGTQLPCHPSYLFSVPYPK